MSAALTATAEWRSSMSSKQVIQRGVYAALGAVKLDYRSPKRLDEAAGIIADFVIAEIARDRRENCKHPRKNGTGMVGSDGSSKMTWSCPDCGQSGGTETPARPTQPVSLW
jgi:hypothetical protein